MREPREVDMGGEIYVGYQGGGSEGWNEYGQRPWEKGFTDDKRLAVEARALYRFQAEWAVMHGPEFRGTSSHWHRNVEGPHVTSDEYHQHLLEKARRYKHRR